MSARGNLSTAGAVPVVNDKGETSMQKVKVLRYKSGRKPDYADVPSDSESDEDDNLQTAPLIRKEKASGSKLLPQSLATARDDAEDDSDQEEAPIGVYTEDTIKSDPRLRRMMSRATDSSDRRSVNEPEIISRSDSSRRRPRRPEAASDNDSDSDEENVERRHELIRRAKEASANDEDNEGVEDLNIKSDASSDEEEDDESEYEEYTESDEDNLPRLKPVFVKKEDRVTVKEREIEEEKARELAEKALKDAEERRLQALKIVEDEVKREQRELEEKEENAALVAAIDAINTDDEDEETEYEMWKLRELKRLKRDKDEREELLKEEEMKERLRNMTEEERQQELAKNPKIITNKAEKGKYRFMQKYYHRGAFYLDQEHEVLKRDVAQPTLEDHFDKSILPAVKQVKNFGRSGRTKYTHLVDQDTTARDSPWSSETPQSHKFVTSQGGGFKQIFERPSKKRKTR